MFENANSDVIAPPEVGDILAGVYQLEALVGRGGMGWVYQATNLRLARTVALKVLSPAAHSNTAEAAERFEREAEMIGSLSHPNIVRIFDYGKTDNGRAFFAMELLKGESLKSLLAREAPLSDAKIFQLTGQILDALTEAHRVGVIHRDLKPDNIFIQATQRTGDQVKLLDFGVAKSFSPTMNGDVEATGTGMIVGSPRFMAPEQARGLGVTPRTDLYQVGLILYQMLAGHQPFRAETLADLMIAHCTLKPARIRRNGGVLTGPLISLVERLLAKDPTDRPASAEATSRLLDACQAAPYDVVLELPAALPLGARPGAASTTSPVGLPAQKKPLTTRPSLALNGMRAAAPVIELAPNQALVSSEAKAMCLPPASAERRRCVHRRVQVSQASEPTLVASASPKPQPEVALVLGLAPRSVEKPRSTAVVALATTSALLVSLCVGLLLRPGPGDSDHHRQVHDDTQSTRLALAPAQARGLHPVASAAPAGSTATTASAPSSATPGAWAGSDLTHFAAGAVGALPAATHGNGAATAQPAARAHSATPITTLGAATGVGASTAQIVRSTLSATVDTAPSEQKLYVGRRYLGRSPQTVTWGVDETPPRVDARRLDASWVSVRLKSSDDGSNKLLKLTRRARRQVERPWAKTKATSLKGAAPR